jgi:hypothetical protein
MVVLNGLTTLTGGIYWQVRDPSDTDVLTLLTARVPPESRNAPIPGVRYPEDERQAWVFDLDAMKEHAAPETASGFPAWASGRVSVRPSVDGARLRFDITPEMLG